MLLVLIAFLSACAQSSLRDPEPEPDAGAPYDFGVSCRGRTLPYLDVGYALHPFECRESTRIEITGANFSFGEDGAGWIGIPDGFEVQGAIACEGDTWIFRSHEVRPSDRPSVEFALLRSGDPRAAFVLESVDPARPWRGWAVPRLEELRDGVEVPELNIACATHEQWELHAEGDERVLRSGERVPDGTHLPQLRLRHFGTPDSVTFWDPALMRSFGGSATAWNGAAGTARPHAASTTCNVWGDPLTFSRTGDTWTVDVRWRVPDADDLDGDDDVEDEIVRHSRYTASVEACR